MKQDITEKEDAKYSAVRLTLRPSELNQIIHLIKLKKMVPIFRWLIAGVLNSGLQRPVFCRV